MAAENEDEIFGDVLRGLERGDFSRLEPHFTGPETSEIIKWHQQGRFQDKSQALAEVLTCACFLGHAQVAEYLLMHGVDASGGTSTGMNALHWAVNRGQLDVVRLLIRHKAPLESRSMYAGTALGTAIWSAINEPRAGHVAIIEELLSAGARVQEAGYPTGKDNLDALLRRYGAS